MIPVVIHGAEGRMGKLVTALVDAAADCELRALVSEPGRYVAIGGFHPEEPLIGQENLAQVLPEGGVIVDFSLAVALDGLLEQAARHRSPLVIGTTGYDDGQLARLEAYAKESCVVLASNFSVGIPALQMVLRMLARTLPEGFDAEQVETHHRGKVDRPSGTARWLGEAWRAERGLDEAPPAHSQRIGGFVGEHTWTIGDGEETLILTHRARSRHAFLRGVLPSIRFASRAEPGLYGLHDVLRDLGENG